MKINKYMQMAIDEARSGFTKCHGGPFGTIIVKDDKVIATGHNKVLLNHDSTCHGEIDAIRRAEEILQTHDLSGCILYTTGEPCSMCLAACKWANIEKVYYGCKIKDNSLIGFRDEELDNMFNGREKFKDYLIELDRDACLKLFEEFNNTKHTLY